MSAPANVLVTGAGGFLGRHLVHHLARSGDRRILAVHRRLPPASGSEVSGTTAMPPNVEQLEADLSQPSSWQRLPEGIDAVAHLAAVLPGTDPDLYALNQAMAEHLADWTVSRPDLVAIVHSSSILVYGRQRATLEETLEPRAPGAYGASKLAAEEVLHRLDLPVASLRFSSIYGRGQSRTSVLPLFIERAQRGEILELYGDGRRMQDFVFVRDACSALELALDRTAAGAFSDSVLNIGSGNPTSMQALAMHVLDLFGAPGARIEHAWNRVDEAPSVTLEIARARRALGYSPAYDLRAGLEACHEADPVTETAG